MPRQPLHIVALADDDPDDREIFVEVCADMDTELEVFLFENGRKLLDYLNAPDSLIPAILFLDINMPVVDGFESLEEIRNIPNFNDLCIIMYSTSISASDVAKAKKLRADGFLQKPSSFGVLKSSIQKILDTDWSDPCAQLDEINFIITA